jgi:hypothetical protein
MNQIRKGCVLLRNRSPKHISSYVHLELTSSSGQSTNDLYVDFDPRFDFFPTWSPGGRLCLLVCLTPNLFVILQSLTTIVFRLTPVSKVKFWHT